MELLTAFKFPIKGEGINTNVCTGGVVYVTLNTCGEVSAVNKVKSVNLAVKLGSVFMYLCVNNCLLAILLGFKLFLHLTDYGIALEQ